MNDITALAQRMLLDFTKPLETESGDPVKYICHDVIEYKCARVCVDAATGTVYSSPYVGLKIRNTSQYAVLRKFTEEAASAYSDFENGYISDMKCGDRSHEYLMFVKEPANVLALVEALEKAQRANAAQDDHINQQQDRIDTLEKRNAELGGQLSRYSMSPGQADQRMCESRAARDALGFGKDADNVAPIDLRERIDGMKARIASLESRTVTVNLTDVNEYLAEVHDKTLALTFRRLAEGVRAGDIAEMTAAGIQVIEGEG